MISSQFSIWIFLFLICYIYIEFLSSILFSNIFKNIKSLTISYTKKNNFIFFKTNTSNLVLKFIGLFFITIKFQTLNIFFSLIIFFIFINLFINRFFKNYLYLLNFNLVLFFILFFFVNNFVIFYLFIELYAILFYFFFLNVNFNFKNLYLIQYKNSLLLYLFNNFLTSMLYLFGLSFIISFYGTINFQELTFFNYNNISWQLYLLIVSFLLKLSLPGFHFLKIELYKYLDISIVILFSIITLYINFLFTLYFFNQNIIFSIINNYKYLTLLLLLSVFFFIHKLKLSNFQEFISFSGFATNNLILLNFVI